MLNHARGLFDNRMDPANKFYINRDPSERKKFLIQDENLKGEYLGACLDYIRWGGQTKVMYEIGIIGLLEFIQEWISSNKENLIWSDKSLPKNFELPFINYKSCPSSKNHKGTINDLEGRLRCTHAQSKMLKPNFIKSYKTKDYFSQMEKEIYYTDEPTHSIPDDAWDEKTGELDSEYKQNWEEYQEEKQMFDLETPSLEVWDYCYSIISDKGTILSLEKVLDRLNLEPKTKLVYCAGYACKDDKEDGWGVCGGHNERNNITIYPFDGWKMSQYVQKWYEQVPEGRAPIFNKPNDLDNFRYFNT